MSVTGRATGNAPPDAPDAFQGKAKRKQPGVVQVWDVVTQREQALLEGSGPVAFAPDGKTWQQQPVTHSTGTTSASMTFTQAGYFLAAGAPGSVPVGNGTMVFSIWGVSRNDIVAYAVRSRSMSL